MTPGPSMRQSIGASCAARCWPALSARRSNGTTSSSTAPSRAWCLRSSIFRAPIRLSGTLEAFGVYAVGFLARPIGAAIFGHYGDRLGRKAALIATLLLMGSATFLVAFVPGYDRIGIWGAILLTVLRFIQGIGVGGEWGGSVLLSMEWAQSNRHRGFIASWPQFGVPAGLFLSNLAVLAVSAWSGDQFLTWGWRVPFLFSIVLIAIGSVHPLGNSGNAGIPPARSGAPD